MSKRYFGNCINLIEKKRPEIKREHVEREKKKKKKMRKEGKIQERGVGEYRFLR
jgi:hypothetical protein